MATSSFGYLSLFSGIGGLDLGIRLAMPAARCVCYVEAEAFSAAVLAARMADGWLDSAPVWSDVRSFPGHLYRGRVEMVVGGFPCQDLSVAGKRAGIVEGNRSSLFFDLLRTADDVGCRYLFLENVTGIFIRPNLDIVLGELASRGWDAEWTSVRASDVGAPHQRERWFCLARRGVGQADTKGTRGQGRELHNGDDRPSSDGRSSNHPEPIHAGHLGDAFQSGLEGGRSLGRDVGGQCAPAERAGVALADAASESDNGCGCERPARRSEPSDRRGPVGEFPPGPADAASWAAVLAERPWLAPALAYPANRRTGRQAHVRESGQGWPRPDQRSRSGESEEAPQPGVRRVFNGSSVRMDLAGGRLDAAASETSTAERLHTVRQADGTETVQRTAREHVCLSSPEVLRPSLHGSELSEGSSDAGIASQTGPPTTQERLRDVRHDGEVSDTPRGSQLAEQRSEQPADAVQFVSYVAAPRTPRHCSCTDAEGVQGVWPDERPIDMQYMQDADSEAAPSDDRGDFMMDAAMAYRTDRLRALGNAVVPAQAAYALRLLWGELCG